MAKPTTQSKRTLNNLEFAKYIMACVDEDGYNFRTNPQSEFGLNVSTGNADGYSVVDKFGKNAEVTTGTYPEDIWEGGGEYTFSTTSDIDTLSSSNTADTQLIKVSGLLGPTSTGEVNGYAQLNGQNKVLIYDNENLTGDPISFWRISCIENEADAGNDLVGLIYCYVDTTISTGVPVDSTKIRAIIDNGNNQCLMAIYTVPLGKVGFLFKGELGVSMTGAAPVAREFATLVYKSRRYGKIFKIKKFVTLMNAANSNYTDIRSFPDPIPALTDIKMTVQEVSVTTGAWAAFDILLINEDKLSPAFLEAIGQPQ